VYAATAPANNIIPNTGSVTYNDGVNATLVTVQSNQVDFVVVPSAASVAVVLDDVGSTTDTPAALADVVEVASATQGATVVFDNVVHNTGGATDTFNIEPYANPTPANDFPAGTTFLLFKADGSSPLMDTNGDGILDTGPMAAAAVYHVFVKAILPTSALGNNGGNGYTHGLRATSITNSAISDTTSDQLTTITASGVDLTNNVSSATATAAQGLGVFGTKVLAAAANAATPITTGVINPGDTYTFALYVNNTSGIPDSYDLLGSIGTAAFGTVSNMPSGWTLDFRTSASGVCATTGQSITNTGTINAAANKLVCAVVTTPATQAAGTTNIYFQVKSPTSGALDIKLDAITINTFRSIKINTNNAGQIFPGGSIVYTHIVTNAGNVTEGAGAANGTTISNVALTLVDSLAASGWTSVIYWDKNNDGVLDANDPVLTDLANLTAGTGGASTAAGLTAGESATLFVKVFAPLGAAINTIDTATITVTTTGLVSGIAAPAAVLNADNTTVIAGQVRLVKTQALDVYCNGGFAAAATAGSFVTTDLNAKPGQCIMYRIVATNAGSADVTGLKVSDATPAFTTYYDINSGVTTAAAAGTIACGAAGTADTLPAASTIRSDAVAVATPTAAGTCGAAATITSTIGTLTPQQFATIYFNVRVNP